MNTQTHAENSGAIAFRKWLFDKGVSDTTGWRWKKNGWVSPFNISGRLYITAADRQQFEARAEAGEFAKAPSGIAVVKG